MVLRRRVLLEGDGRDVGSVGHLKTWNKGGGTNPCPSNCKIENV